MIITEDITGKAERIAFEPVSFRPNEGQPGILSSRLEKYGAAGAAGVVGSDPGGIVIFLASSGSGSVAFFIPIDGQHTTKCGRLLRHSAYGDPPLGKLSWCAPAMETHAGQSCSGEQAALLHRRLARYHYAPASIYAEAVEV